MPALFLGITLTLLWLLHGSCVGQTAKPQWQAMPPSTGHSCVFRAESDIDIHPNCVLQDGRGKLFIAQDYVKKLEFDSHGMAVVFNEDPSRQRWMYVDRKGRVVVNAVPMFDNWADEFSDGLVRTVIDDKYGFADRRGEVVIAAKYDGAFPFLHGQAVVCIGCSEICANSDHPRATADVDCEHHMLTGGQWFKINKVGRVVARCQPNSCP